MNNKGQIYCGNDYGKHGIGFGCTSPCQADSGSICGGSWQNSIYEIIEGKKYSNKEFNILINITE